MKVNRELIDAEFEGYKLSLDAIPTYSLSFPEPLEIPSPADEQVSLLLDFSQLCLSIFLPFLS